MKYSEFLQLDTTETICGIYCITNITNGKKYIGLSSDIYTRWKSHARADGHCTAIHAAINKYGLDHFDFCVLEECDASELFNREIASIEFHNSVAPNGYNLTSGGDGVRDKCGSTLELMSKNLKARWEDPESRKKLIDGMNTDAALQRKSEIMLERYESQEAREAHSEILRKRWADQEFKERVTATFKELWQGDDAEEKRAKAREATLRVWEEKSEEEKHIELLAAHRKDPVKNAEISAKIRESLNKPDVKEKRSKAISEALQNPERRKKMSDRSKAKWQDPDFKKKSSESIKASWSTPERKIGRCFTRRINGYIPTFEEGWQLALSKGYGEEWYDYALSYFHEYAKKVASASSDLTQTEQSTSHHVPS